MFGDPLMFTPAPPSGQYIHFYTRNIIMGALLRNLLSDTFHFGNSVSFSEAPSSDQSVNFAHNIIILIKCFKQIMNC